MSYFSNDEFLAIVETKIDHRQVNLISPTFITPGHYRSKVYDETTHMTQLEDIQGQNIQLANEFSLPEVDNINRHLFQIIIYACNNLRANLQSSIHPDRRQENYSSIGVKDHDYNRTTHSFDKNSIHLLTRGLIKNIDQQEIDWGLIYYFSENSKTQERGINIELIHPQCSCTFFIPVKCSKGIFTTLRIKARNIKLLNTHHNHSIPLNSGSVLHKQISGHEFLLPSAQKRSWRDSILEVKFMLKRFIRSGRFLVSP